MEIIDAAVTNVPTTHRSCNWEKVSRSDRATVAAGLHLLADTCRLHGNLSRRAKQNDAHCQQVSECPGGA